MAKSCRGGKKAKLALKADFIEACMQKQELSLNVAMSSTIGGESLPSKVNSHSSNSDTIASEL